MRDFIAIAITRFSPAFNLSYDTMTDTGAILTVPKIDLLTFIRDFQDCSDVMDVPSMSGEFNGIINDNLFRCRIRSIFQI
ncbi:hypothetical protein NM75_14490 [Dickeya fangzhongdai]|nr:hypothetical protein LH89_20120 [Dickeya fangzhongdai]KGT97555.1 hypothetical protein NM75_14490 [Dickeya fangzhongdai]